MFGRVFYTTVILLITSTLSAFADSYPGRVPVAPTDSGGVLLNESVQTFSNPECEKRNTCDLKSFKVHVSNVQYFIKNDNTPSYMTTLVASYETETVAQLQKYGIVQMNKGCKFESYPPKNGISRRATDIDKYTFGKDSIPYYFPNWINDNNSWDPLDWSGLATDQACRHMAYLWNSVKNSYQEESQHFYANSTPDYPELYVTDIPGTAFVSPTNKAINASQKFRTCLVIANEVPTNVVLTNTNFTTPLVCFDWDNSFVYDHEKEVFVSSGKIDDYCSPADDKPTYRYFTK